MNRPASGTTRPKLRGTDMAPLDDWFAAQKAEEQAEQTRVTFEEWIARRTWRPGTHTEDRELYFSNTLIDSYGNRQPPIGFTEAESWGDQPYRVVWVGQEHRAIITFCEGDLDYTVSPTPEAFQRHKRATAQFYKELKS